MDQATTLRQIVKSQRAQEAGPKPRSGRPRVISITSGKGGVGKTNIVLNLGLALGRLGRKVLVLDADMGLSNLDVLLGLTPRYTLEHVMNGRKDILEIILTGPEGVRILPSGSGISELSEMTFEQQMFLFKELSRIEDDLDYLLIDTGAGISSNVLRFNASANEVVVVANPEPTSITDAYALMKLLAIKYHLRDFGLIANAVISARDGDALYERLNGVCTQFLQVNLAFLGAVPFDANLRKAVRQQRALIELYPASPAGKSLSEIAARLDRAGASTPAHVSAPAPAPAEKPASFWDRLLHWQKVR
ncbi:MAG: MinD/ParA family protein [Candidatus Lambdaproteobacteria bacterium]|nr:MinD/ParA family protein [Candidatus Lambdaproteobacteria bacterium]